MDPGKVKADQGPQILVHLVWSLEQEASSYQICTAQLQTCLWFGIKALETDGRPLAVGSGGSVQIGAGPSSGQLRWLTDCRTTQPRPPLKLSRMFYSAEVDTVWC